jgi:novobiocin biosynthesis protein NovU/D-mycarose 3-C-methyltransferase
MPLANAFLTSLTECSNEASLPLAVAACPNCQLVQLTYVVPAQQLYRRYPYVSSTSPTVRRYAQDLASRLVTQYRLDSSGLVVELGSNDGLVLKAFQGQGVRVLGVEPARNLARIARANGVTTLSEFFNHSTAARLVQEKGQASILLGRHVFAHIDDLHDFFRGVHELLTPEGAVLIEVPYLGNLIRQLEFDTIYHEHLSYFSLEPVQILCERHGFRLIDVEEVPLHGGSILLTLQRASTGKTPTGRVKEALLREHHQPLANPVTLREFARRVEEWKQRFETLIEKLDRQGARFIGYGAAAKANTLLNLCPEVAKRLAGILDRNPHKQGLYTPGTHLPVINPDGFNPDGITHMLILAWNFKEEIIAQWQPFAKRGGRFVVPIPEPQVI